LGGRVLLHAGVGTGWMGQVVVNSLVVVVYSDREHFFGLFLTNHMLIQVLEDLENNFVYI
jgi:hypothetical protein